MTLLSINERSRLTWTARSPRRSPRSAGAGAADSPCARRTRRACGGEGGAGARARAFDPASVLGEEHREKLAREAGAKPSAAHKSKNQIGSLLYEAKQAELKILEGRLAGASHKAAAKRKYGW